MSYFTLRLFVFISLKPVITRSRSTETQGQIKEIDYFECYECFCDLDCTPSTENHSYLPSNLVTARFRRIREGNQDRTALTDQAGNASTRCKSVLRVKFEPVFLIPKLAMLTLRVHYEPLNSN